MSEQSIPARVTFVMQSWVPGGMETHCLDLAEEYLRRGIKTGVILPRSTTIEDLARRFSDAGIAVERIETDGRAGRLAQIAGLWTALRAMRRLRPDVVHLQTGGATGGLAVIALARLAGATAIITEHDVPAEHPGRGQRIARFLMDRLAHGIIAVSRRNAGIRRQRIAPPERKFAVVLNGVPMAPDDPGASRVAAARRAEAGIGSDRPIAGSVVRLTPGKGLDTLLDAFALCRERVDGELLLVGDGPLRENLEGHARALGIAAHIHFVGHQSNPGEWMLALDTFVLPVPSGTMSIALLEAMARGVPPIITFGGPEEAVIDNETGLCPPPSQPQALADAMVSLLQDQPRRDALGRAAKEHVRKHFSVARVADDTLAVYAGARRGGLPQRLQASAPPSRYP